MAAKLHFISREAATSLMLGIEARYDWEPDSNKRRPVCLYPREDRFSKEAEYSEEKHGELKRRIAVELKRLMEEHY